MTSGEKFEEIVRRCKGSVHLDVNDHRSDYESLDTAIREAEQEGICNESDAQSVRQTGNIYRLQFYPDTPIGFYVGIGGSFEDVVDQALAILSKESRR